MEEAKRRLATNNTNKVARQYYCNLNTKLRSSVAGVMRATQDLGRQRQASEGVYMPWMMGNYGRKLAIEALKRRGNTAQMNASDKRDNKSPYVSQYYAGGKSILVTGLKSICAVVRRVREKEKITNQIMACFVDSDD